MAIVTRTHTCLQSRYTRVLLQHKTLPRSSPCCRLACWCTPDEARNGSQQQVAGMHRHVHCDHTSSTTSTTPPPAEELQLKSSDNTQPPCTRGASLRQLQRCTSLQAVGYASCIRDGIIQPPGCCCRHFTDAVQTAAAPSWRLRSGLQLQPARGKPIRTQHRGPQPRYSISAAVQAHTCLRRRALLSRPCTLLHSPFHRCHGAPSHTGTHNNRSGVYGFVVHGLLGHTL
jgi:hypothetical protein